MNHLLQLLLLLALVVVAAKLAGSVANRFGQPSVFGEILIGLLLGPTVFDVLHWSLFLPHVGEALAHGAEPPPSLLAVVRDLAEIGVIMLMFIAGMETNLEEMKRVGKVAFWSATGGVIFPLAGGIAVSSAFGLPVFWDGIFIGTILTATSVSISAQTLIELGQLKSKEGSTILGAAVIDDVQGIILLSLVVAFARATGEVELGEVGLVLIRMVAYFAVAIFLGRYLGRVASWADRLGVSQGLLAMVLAIAFLYAWAAEALGGVAAITGSYLAGVLFAQTPHKHRIDAGVHPLTYSMLVPVFFISIGLAANGRELGEQIGYTVSLVLVAIAAKALGCGVFARATGFNTQESIRVGVGMISRGEVGLIVAGYGLAHGIIGRDVFSAAVIMVLVTTMVTPPLLRLAFPRVEGAPTMAVVEETVGNLPPEAEGGR